MLTNKEKKMISYLSCDYLEQFMKDVFQGIGVLEQDARICAKVVIVADKRGIDFHGIGRLKPIYYDRIANHKIQQPVTQIKVVRDRLATAVIDAHHGIGMVISTYCMNLAIEKAKKYGLGLMQYQFDFEQS